MSGGTRLAIVDSHPIQYHVPWIRGLAQACDLTVFYAHQPSTKDQAAAGYGVGFEWDVDLLSGYRSVMLENVAREPNVFELGGCDTPEIDTRLRRGRFDTVIVTGWYLKSYWQAILCCRRQGIPLLVRGDSHLETPRGLAKRLGKELVYPRMLRLFDAFLCVGWRNREYLQHYGVPEERIFDAPHFVDNAFFRERSHLTSDERQAQRSEWGTRPGDAVVLFVGRFAELKRTHDVIDALAELGRRAARGWLAVFVGAGEPEAALRAQAERLGVRAVFVGFKNQSELPRIYAAADVLVLPSAHETWGLVVNEAMACGTPAVVSSEVGCAPDMIEPGRTGEVFEMGDVQALAAALERVVAGEPEQIREALAAKVGAYSCGRAVEGTLEAVRAVVRAGRA